MVDLAHDAVTVASGSEHGVVSGMLTVIHLGSDQLAAAQDGRTTQGADRSDAL
jgi:hypothetical protein